MKDFAAFKVESDRACGFVYFGSFSEEAIALFALLPRVSSCSRIAFVSANAIPRLAVVYAEIPGSGVFCSVIGFNRTACYRTAQLDLRGGGRCSGLAFFAIGTVSAVFTVLAIGTDGVALGVGHQRAVQRPVPVSVLLLGQADLRGGAVRSVLALLAVVNRNRVAVEEGNGVARHFSAQRNGGDGGNHVVGVQQLLQGTVRAPRCGWCCRSPAPTRRCRRSHRCMPQATAQEPPWVSNASFS